MINLRIDVMFDLEIDEKASNDDLEKLINNTFKETLSTHTVNLQEITRNHNNEIVSVFLKWKETS